MIVSDDDQSLIDRIVASAETMRAIGYRIERGAYGLDRFDAKTGWCSDSKRICALAALILTSDQRKNQNGIGNVVAIITNRGYLWIDGFASAFDQKKLGDHTDMHTDEWAFGFAAGEEVGRRLFG